MIKPSNVQFSNKYPYHTALDPGLSITILQRSNWINIKILQLKIISQNHGGTQKKTTT